MVLLKGFGQDGFRFFTNHESRKGKELVRAAAAPGLARIPGVLGGVGVPRRDGGFPAPLYQGSRRSEASAVCIEAACRQVLPQQSAEFL